MDARLLHEQRWARWKRSWLSGGERDGGGRWWCIVGSRLGLALLRAEASVTLELRSALGRDQVQWAQWQQWARPGRVRSSHSSEARWGARGAWGAAATCRAVTQALRRVGRSWSLFARYVPYRGVIDKAAGAPRRPPTMALTRPAVVPMWQASKQAAPCEASPRYPWEWMSTVSSSVQCPGTPSPALDVKFNLSSFTEYLPVVFAMSTSQYVLRTSASNPAAAGGARRSCPSLCCRCRVGRTAAAWPLRGRCVAAGSANCLTFSILSLSSLSLVGRHTSTTRHTPFLSKTSSPRASSAPPLTNPDFVRCTRNAQTHVLVQTCKTKAELSSSRRQTTPDFPYTD